MFHYCIFQLFTLQVFSNNFPRRVNQHRMRDSSYHVSISSFFCRILQLYPIHFQISNLIPPSLAVRFTCCPIQWKPRQSPNRLCISYTSVSTVASLHNRVYTMKPKSQAKHTFPSPHNLKVCLDCHPVSMP